jgi:SAM-dependent methyltransferase
MAKADHDELTSIVEAWRRSIVHRDVAAAEALRDERYRLMIGKGPVLTKELELALIAESDVELDRLDIEDLRIDRRGNLATAMFHCLAEGRFSGWPATFRYRSAIRFTNRNGEWKAIEWRVEDSNAPQARPASVRESVRRWFRRPDTNLRTPSFPEVAFIPYRGRQDYALPKMPSLPLAELWLGYNARIHGKTLVDRMLEIVYASGLALQPGDRILDLGCGFGRMIRHLEHVAATCEIWGTDISAERILWCKRYLSPPFRFATTTKVPHLPFEDRSFRFIYCGSVFTHIDDLADAWLLELRRILTADGRLYVTIHDNRTLEWVEDETSAWGSGLRWIRTRDVYRQANDSFDMFTVGRDDWSQVFYDRDYFARMAGSIFKVLSITPDAYFNQTAFLLTR